MMTDHVLRYESDVTDSHSNTLLTPHIHITAFTACKVGLLSSVEVCELDWFWSVPSNHHSKQEKKKTTGGNIHLDGLQQSSVGLSVLPSPLLLRPWRQSQHALGASLQLVVEAVQEGGAGSLLTETQRLS